MSISVVIPIGPKIGHVKWLHEAIQSVEDQTVQPDALIMVWDGRESGPGFKTRSLIPINFSVPWRVGVPSAFNIGVGLAQTDCVLFLGSDDTLHPRCIETCVEAWERHGRKDAYYWMGVRYIEGSAHNESQMAPCNAAMVTKTFWEDVGGFPLEGAIGSVDSMLISMLIGKAGDRLIQVDEEKILYYARRHDEQETAMKGPEWQGPVFTVRDLLTREFVPSWS